MASNFLLTVIIYSILSRYMFINFLPPVTSGSVLLYRILTAGLSIGSIYLVYSLIADIFNSRKLGLLTAFIFAVTPWVTEQSRIYSEVNNCLFLLLLAVYFWRKYANIYFRSCLTLIVLSGIYFVYPSLWLFAFFKPGSNLPKLQDFMNNIFTILSPDYLFFRNISFWWGGIKDFGVMFIIFLPFWLYGIYGFLIQKKYYFFLIFFIIVLFTSLSVKFPETREFFLSVPILSLFTATGLKEAFKPKNNTHLIICIIFIALFSYELSQYQHYYTVHYSKEIQMNKDKINGLF